MNLLVVGAGAMGRWFAASVRAAVDEVTFVDADEHVAREAADAVAGDIADAARTDVEGPFDLVCLAVPIPEATAVIETFADRVDGAMCDVTGEMAAPVEAMQTHVPEAERMSLHPLFAPENAPGTVATVTDSGGPVTSTVRDELVAAGNRIVATTPAEHDEAMETVQARVHTAVLAFALAADDVPDKFQTPVSAELFDLVEQVTDGDPRVYADIQDAFEGAEDVASAAADIAAADHEDFVDLYERSR